MHRVIYRFIALAFDSSPIKGEGDSVGCVVVALPCGYCLKACMTGPGWLFWACWVDCVLSESGFTGLWRIYRIGTMRCIVFTLTFDSSPIKGEGDSVGLDLLLPRPVD